MSLGGKHIVSINDLSNGEIELILDVADEFQDQLSFRNSSGPALNHIMAMMFFEPSTRTYLSFASAMNRLGGDVIGMPDAAHQSSVAKGESIADTARVVESYSDLFVMRHPLDGSTRVASEYLTKIPFISGGDGAHEHPTQTLLDLYTIRREKGTIKGQTVAIFGDLLHSRTIHSLAYGLVRLGGDIVCVAPPGLGLPPYVRESLQDLGWAPKEFETLEEAVKGDLVLYQAEGANGKPRRKDQAQVKQQALIEVILKQFDAMYFTRLQAERFEDEQQLAATKEAYTINRAILNKAGEETLIMHPLPRRSELAYEFDRDKRAAYFRQAGYGVPVRMALVSLLLGLVESSTSAIDSKPVERRTAQGTAGVECENIRCVTRQELYVTPRFWQVPGNTRLLGCYYCDQEMIKPIRQNAPPDAEIVDGAQAKN